MPSILSTWSSSRAWEELSRNLLDLSILMVGMTVAIFGTVLFRPAGLFDTVWPANAVFLGLMLRNSRYAAWFFWAFAGALLLAADLMTGVAFMDSGWRTIANLAGVGAGYLMFSRVDTNDIQLRTPGSIMYLLLIGIVASFVTSMFAVGVNVAAKGSFDSHIWFGWFGSGMVVNVVMLPTILSAPALADFRHVFKLQPPIKANFFRAAAPAFSVVLSLVAAWYVGGPGAMAFPVPALIWCALTYSTFLTSFATLVVTLCVTVAIGAELGIYAGALESEHYINSLRLGATLLAVGPIAVSAVSTAKNDVANRLKRTATHDYLTDALTLSAFTKDAAKLLYHLSSVRRSVAVLVCDVDKFKFINDSYGHSVGDQVLVAFANTVIKNIRHTDLFGRIGGDEFVLILSDVQKEEAEIIASRIQKMFANEAIQISDELVLNATATFGGIALVQAYSDLMHLVEVADGVLNRAKADGRNRIMMSDYHQVALLSTKVPTRVV